MFEFLFVIGIVLAFYGYSAMKNTNVWGDQGRDEIKPENWNGYVVHNGQFMMYGGFFLAALAALDVNFDFAGWLYILILLGGLAMIFYPLAHWMHEKEGKWWPWPKHKKKKRNSQKPSPSRVGGPAGPDEGKAYLTTRKRVIATSFALISQWSGPLTASPVGEANANKNACAGFKPAQAFLLS